MSIENPLEHPPYAHTITRAFLTAAIEAGAFTIPEHLRHTRKGLYLAKANNILGAYYMSPATYFDVGSIYGGITKDKLIHVPESIRDIIENRMRQVWEANPQLQEEFPWDSLVLGKPPSLRSRMRNSLGHGSTNIKVKQQLEAGILNLDQIASNIETNRKNVSASRKPLKRWGLVTGTP